MMFCILRKTSLIQLAERLQEAVDAERTADVAASGGTEQTAPASAGEERNNGAVELQSAENYLEASGPAQLLDESTAAPASESVGQDAAIEPTGTTAQDEENVAMTD